MITLSCDNFQQMGTFIREVDLDHLENPLIIHQQFESDVGGVVWDGALVLANFLVKSMSDAFPDADVVELGCGTGLVGLVCATFPARRVILTDLLSLKDLAVQNIAANKSSLKADCEFRTLEWSKAEDILEEFGQKPKFIIASECVYYEEAVEPLVSAMQSLSDEHTHILISLELRPGEKNIAALRFFFKEAKRYFDFTDVPKEKMHRDYSCDEIKVFILQKKKL